MKAKSGQSALRKAVTGDKSKRVRDLIHETRKKPKVIRLIDKIAFTVYLFIYLFIVYFIDIFNFNFNFF